MKKIIFLITIILYSLSCIAQQLPGTVQSTTTNAQYKSGPIELNKFISKKFGEEKKKYDLNVCQISAVFVKFTIDSAGNVRHLSFSDLKGTPQVFRTVLTSVILATNGSWIPGTVNGKPVESEPFILPVVYSMEAGCNPRDIQPDNVKVKIKPIPNGLETSLLYILDFDDNVGSNTPQLDCILLRPLYVFSQN